MTGPLVIDPRIGDAILQIVEKTTGRQCHIILAVFPIEEPDDPAMEGIGTPAFVSSMAPHDVTRVLIEVGEMVKRNPNP